MTNEDMSVVKEQSRETNKQTKEKVTACQMEKCRL